MGKSFVHQENPVVTGIETYTEKKLLSESYSAADYRIGRICLWILGARQKQQKSLAMDKDKPSLSSGVLPSRQQYLIEDYPGTPPPDFITFVSH